MLYQKLNKTVKDGLPKKGPELFDQWTPAAFHHFQEPSTQNKNLETRKQMMMKGKRGRISWNSLKLIDGRKPELELEFSLFKNMTTKHTSFMRMRVTPSSTGIKIKTKIMFLRVNLRMDRLVMKLFRFGRSKGVRKRVVYWLHLLSTKYLDSLEVSISFSSQLKMRRDKKKSFWGRNKEEQQQRTFLLIQLRIES